MSQDINISTLVLNKLTKDQYSNIATPSNTELYFVTDDDTYLLTNQGTNNASKVLTVGNDGIVVPQALPSSTTDYEDLSNKPSINNIALSGNKTAADLGFANVAMTAEYSDLLNTPSIPAAQVQTDWNATTGMGVLLNKPTLANIAISGEYSDLINAPVLANVATSGEYDDLLNKPSIPSPQVNSDWNATSGIAEILNKPTLSTVATSGDYNDLTNKPVIPSNFANVAFSGDYNDLSNTPVLGTAAYANTSDFATAAEGNLATTAVQPGDLANVATTGDYNDLLNTPTIPAAQVNADWNALSGVAQILNKPTLANIATTGEYSDLVNKPVIGDLVNTAQLNAINSTITQNLVNTYSEHVADANIHVTVSNKTTWDNKQDAISTGLVEFNENPDFMLSAVLVYNGTSINGDAIGLLDQETILQDDGTISSYNSNNYGAAMDSFVPTVRAVADGLDEKQNTLVSGTNIKTINNTSLLGAGNISIVGLPSQISQSGKFLTTDGTNASWASLANVATTGEYSDLLNTPTIPNVPVVVQDFYVNGTTGAIDCTFSATPTTKTVHTIIGNTVINGTWSGNTFTPTTADDILNNANGFVVAVF